MEAKDKVVNFRQLAHNIAIFDIGDEVFSALMDL
jgi:hypothetical protein